MDIPPAQPTQATGSRVEALAARLAAPVPEPPYDPPTPAEEAESAPDQPSFADAAGEADSQVNPEVEATEGVDGPVATDAQILETECMEMVAGAADTEYLDGLDVGVKADKGLPAAAKKRLLKASKEKRAELAK